MDQKIIQAARLWGQNAYFSEEDRKEIAALIDRLPATETELTERFYRDLEFGTGGLRAPMGMGQNRMNKYNVRRATQALTNTILKHFGKDCSAVISYDSRNCSRDFALEAAGVFAANGVKAWVFPQLTPTPMLSFAVRHLKAQAGIMITASHNPPIYNGFKAFWADGAQVVPPYDKEIITAYNALTDWGQIRSMSFEEAVKKNLAGWTPEEVNEAFYRVIEEKVILDPVLIRNHGAELSVVYTSIHGTGEVPCTTIARRLGFTKFVSVPEQSAPDGNFPSVKYPNPEDPKALELAVNLMMKTNADIVCGTDPDCDRLGLVVNDHGKPAYPNGNQIGALMLYYIFSRRQELGKLPKNPLVLKSIVTSPLQNAIVESFGGKVEDTLTGFKWMAGRLREHEETKSPMNFVFASEESFGYMLHADARDKDGVSSVASISEIALWFKKKGMNLMEALDLIYETYGFFYESLVSQDYEGIEGTKKIDRIMEYFRNYPETHFAGEKIVGKEDYLKGLTLPKSNVLSFSLDSGNKLFLRPSGTEPKIKFYTMVRERSGTIADMKFNALNKVKTIEDKIRECCEKA